MGSPKSSSLRSSPCRSYKPGEKGGRRGAEKRRGEKRGVVREGEGKTKGGGERRGVR